MILLVMAAVGVWTADIVNRWTIPQLKQRIDAMRPLARELVIKDPAKIAVVKREELWYDDNEWDIYLPEADFQLSLATREVDRQGLAPPAKTVFLPSGKFSLTFLQEKHEAGWRVRVIKDGEELIAVEEPQEWYPAHGSTGGGQFSLGEQRIATEPVVLFRRRFTRPVSPTSSQVPTGPCEGVLLWIEPVPGAKSRQSK
jgi:hypothetical protein